MREWEEVRKELLQDTEVREAYKARAVERKLVRVKIEQRLSQKGTQPCKTTV